MDTFYFRQGDFRRGLLAYYDAAVPDDGGGTPEGFSAGGEETAPQKRNGRSAKGTPAPSPAAPAEPVDSQLSTEEPETETE